MRGSKLGTLIAMSAPWTRSACCPRLANKVAAFHFNTSAPAWSALNTRNNTFTTLTSPPDAPTTTTGEGAAAACPTTIPRPRLSPLPYIYLRDLPYDLASDLQQFLVDRQIRLRQEKDDRLKANPEQAIEGAGAAASNDLLLIVEHSPTYTNGRRNRGAQAISEQEAERLRKLGATYVESLRGGEITFHGPGQLVAYPILDLKPIKLSVRCYVSHLEKAIIATCAQWGVKAITTENTGVWINDQKKIAAIGVHVQRYITSHGLALNCNTDLDFFKEIIACGLTGKETTTLEKEVHANNINTTHPKDQSIDVPAVLPSFLNGFGQVFNRAVVPLADRDPEFARIVQDYLHEHGYGETP